MRSRPNPLALILGALVFGYAVPAAAQVIIQDDFEAADANCWSGPEDSKCGAWTIYGHRTSLAVGDIRHSGSRALKITFTGNEDAGGGLVSFPEESHIFTRYYDYYANSFDFACGMKVHRMSSFNEGAGINFFDTIDVLWGKGGGASERDFCGINEPDHIGYGGNGGPVDWNGFDGNPGMVRQTWYCVEHELRLNDPGSSNAEVRVWVDGQPVIQATGFDIRASLTAGLDSVLFGGWYSNGCGGQNPCPDPIVPSIRYIDDVVVGKSRIGCLGSPSPDGGAVSQDGGSDASTSPKPEAGANPDSGNSASGGNADGGG